MSNTKRSPDIIKIKKLLKSLVKEICRAEQTLDVELDHIWLYKNANSIVKVELALYYTNQNDNYKGKKIEIYVDTNKIKIEGDIK